MADYYSIVARAIRGLDPNTPAARRRLHDRARSALLSAPIPRSEIVIAQMALDTAIEQVEADAGLMALEKSVDTLSGTADRRFRRWWSNTSRNTGDPTNVFSRTRLHRQA
jgi:hypothetical protein